MREGLVSKHVPTPQSDPTMRIQGIWHIISKALAPIDGVVATTVDEATSAFIQIHHQSIFVSIQVCDGYEVEQPSGSLSSSLTLTVSKQSRINEPIKFWQDTHAAALEAKLKEIIVEIVVLAEIKERDAQTTRYELQVARRNQDCANQLERKSQRQCEVETEADARLSSLLELAQRHDQANTLRCLLAKVDAMHPSAPDLEIQQWRSIVASEIERLDPLVNKRFLSVVGINLHSAEAASTYFTDLSASSIKRIDCDNGHAGAS